MTAISDAGAERSNNPLVTICLPTHRRPQLLQQTLLSCFEQDYRPLEIIVGDDSPDDASQLLVESLCVPSGIELRYWRNVPGLGQAGNVNGLFANARGSRLVLIHDDDLLLPGAISAMDAAWSTVDDVVAVFGMQHILTDSGELDEVETDFKAAYYKRDRAHVGQQRELLVSAFWRQFPNNGYLIDTQAARRAGYRPFEDIGHACDTDFSIRLAMQSHGRSFLMIDRVTSQYRNNKNSLSRSNDVTWKIYEFLLTLDGLSDLEREARDSLLREIAAQATKENALHGRRRAALSIFFSKYYPREHGYIKSIYHLGLILSPRVQKLHRLRRAVSRRSSFAWSQAGPELRSGSTASAAGHGRASARLTITLVSQKIVYGHGQGRANLELVKEALRLGHRVNIIASEVDADIGASPNVWVHVIDVRSLWTQLIRDAVFDLRAQRIIRRLRDTTDILHINGAVVKAASDVNTVHFVHGSYAKFGTDWRRLVRSPYRLYQFAYTWLNSNMERQSFKSARLIVAVSESVAADLIGLGVEPSKIVVIYNGIDLEEFRPGFQARSELGFPSEGVLGIFVGDINGNRKNLDTVLRAMVVNPELHLVVLANASRSEAPALAAELGVANRVAFVGERSDVAACMRAVDMLIFPSRYEPFGMVVLEALASGLPTIVSRAAGASEIIGRESGIVINDPDSVVELSSAITKLIENLPIRQAMGRNGRLIAESFSWADMARRYVEQYWVLTGERGSSPKPESRALLEREVSANAR